MRLRALAVVRQLDAGRDDAGLAEEDRGLACYHEKTGWRATLWREPKATRRRRSNGVSWNIINNLWNHKVLLWT